MSHGSTQRGGAAAAVLQPVLLPPGCQRPDSPRHGAATRGGGHRSQMSPPPRPLLPRPQPPGSAQDSPEPPAPHTPCPAPGVPAPCRSEGCLQGKGTAPGHPHRALTPLNSMLKERAARAEVLGAGPAPSPCRTPPKPGLGARQEGPAASPERPARRGRGLGEPQPKVASSQQGQPQAVGVFQHAGIFFFFKTLAFNSQPKQLFPRDSSRRGEKAEPLRTLESGPR